MGSFNGKEEWVDTLEVSEYINMWNCAAGTTKPTPGMLLITVCFIVPLKKNLEHMQQNK